MLLADTASRDQLEAELRRLIPQWEETHGRPFLVNGVSFIEGLDEQIRAEEQEKENRKVRPRLLHGC